MQGDGNVFSRNSRVFRLPDGSWVAEEDVSEDLTIVGEGRTREEALEELWRVREELLDEQGQ